MTREQEQAIEALCLRDGGFAKVESVKLVETTGGRRYLVPDDGRAIEIDMTAEFPARRLQALVYGAGATA